MLEGEGTGAQMVWLDADSMVTGGTQVRKRTGVRELRRGTGDNRCWKVRIKVLK